MKRRIVSSLFVLFLSAGFLLFASQAPAQSTKAHFVGWMENPQWLAIGNVWLSNGNLHLSERVVKWDSYATDPRIVGAIIDVLNGNFFLNNQVFEGKFWGEITINLSDGSYWEGSFNGEVVGGLQQGTAIAHGNKGSIDGLKLKMTFLQRAGASPTIFDFEGTILNPKGD
jgi:hypothetical protein